MKGMLGVMKRVLGLGALLAREMRFELIGIERGVVTASSAD